MAEGERQTYKITDPVYGRSIKVTTDRDMTATYGKELLNQTFGGRLTFDDLENDSNYLTDLQSNYFIENGEKYTGGNQELIEKDFEYWNMIDNNLTVGANEIFSTFKDLSQLDAQRMLRRYDTYERTNATGEGSRSGWEQFKGVSKAMVLDPANYAGGAGLFKTLAMKLGGKGAMRFILTKIAGPAAIGASYAATANAENQQMKVQFGERESIDGGELAANTAIGTIAGPIAPLLVGGAAKVIKAPFKIKSSIQGGANAAVETLGGQKAAQTGVIDAGKKAMDGGAGHSSAAETASAGLSDELKAANKIFTDDYKALGNLDVRPQTINTFQERIYSEGIKRGSLPDLDDAVRQMQQGKITPTEALREIKRILGKTAYDKDFNSSSNILKRLKTEAQDIFDEGAARSGKSKEAAELDARYSDFLGLDSKIKKAAGSDSRVSGLINTMVSSPAKSKILINEYLTEINRIAKYSGNKDFVQQQTDLLRMSMSEQLFAGNSAKFKNFVRSQSGRQALRKLYPDVKDETMLKWAKILENSQDQGSAALFWGRYIAQGLAATIGVVAGSSGGVVGMGGGMVASMVIFRGLLNSPQFTNLAMRVYSKDKINEPVLNRMEKFLVSKGIPEPDARKFVIQMTGQVVTKGTGANPPDIAINQVSQYTNSEDKSELTVAP